MHAEAYVKQAIGIEVYHALRRPREIAPLDAPIGDPANHSTIGNCRPVAVRSGVAGRGGSVMKSH